MVALHQHNSSQSLPLGRLYFNALTYAIRAACNAAAWACNLVSSDLHTEYCLAVLSHHLR
jgi:hypothetical protein